MKVQEWVQMETEGEQEIRGVKGEERGFIEGGEGLLKWPRHEGATECPTSTVKGTTRNLSPT
jgi:hypothetical protein